MLADAGEMILTGNSRHVRAHYRVDATPFPVTIPAHFGGYVFDNAGPTYTSDGSGDPMALYNSASADPTLASGVSGLGDCLLCGDMGNDNGVDLAAGAPSAPFEFGQAAFSILVDFKWIGPAGDYRLIDKGHTAGGKGWMFGTTQTDSLHLFTIDGGGTDDARALGGLDFSVASRVIAVADNGVARFYHNGANVTDPMQNTTRTPIGADDRPMAMAAASHPSLPGGNQLHGYIKRVLFYNFAISDAQAAALGSPS